MVIEIELRARIDDKNSFIQKLKTKEGVIYKSSLFQHDEYFKHVTDLDRDLVLRIRTEDNGKSILTFKAKDTSGGDNAWADVDAILDDADNLRKIFLTNKYELVVDIKKNRESFEYNGYEINVDDIKGLGFFVEIEGRGSEEERNNIESNLKQILSDLGVSENDFVSKGYVPLMIEKNNA